MNESLSILVAEDDPQDVFLFKRAFSNAGINVPVIFVCDGQEVIDYLQGAPPFEDRKANPWPALIILDLTMPRLDGFEVLEWMRDRKVSTQIPVLAFSGVQNPSEISRAYALGAKFFLIKTADASQWINILNRVVEMYGLSRDAVATMSAAESEFPVVYQEESAAFGNWLPPGTYPH